MPKKKLIPIILCCGSNGRAVVFGRVEAMPEAGGPVTLREARMVIYWSSECGGLLGLAAHGPKTSTRITAPVPVVIETSWQECVACTPEGASAIDAWRPC
jgi:hypothetical protein